MNHVDEKLSKNTKKICISINFSIVVIPDKSYRLNFNDVLILY